MALIGKDGKDDSSRMLGIAKLGLPPSRLTLPVKRTFVKVVMKDLKAIPDSIRNDSAEYREQIQAMGLVDFVFTEKNGDTVVVFSVKDQAEAKSLAENDPIVAAGLVGKMDIAAV